MSDWKIQSSWKNRKQAATALTQDVTLWPGDIPQNSKIIGAAWRGKFYYMLLKTPDNCATIISAEIAYRRGKGAYGVRVYTERTSTLYSCPANIIEQANALPSLFKESLKYRSNVIQWHEQYSIDQQHKKRLKRLAPGDQVSLKNRYYTLHSALGKRRGWTAIDVSTHAKTTLTPKMLREVSIIHAANPLALSPIKKQRSAISQSPTLDITLHDEASSSCKIASKEETDATLSKNVNKPVGEQSDKTQKSLTIVLPNKGRALSSDGSSEQPKYMTLSSLIF